MINGRSEVLMAAFVATEGAALYSAVLPSIFTIRSFGGQPWTRKAIRDGELIGTLFTLCLGSVVSALIGSRLPLYFSIGTVAAMVSVYEYALRSVPAELRSGSVPVAATAELVKVDPGVWRAA